MDNLDELIEKYKRDMLRFSKRSTLPQLTVQEETEEIEYDVVGEKENEADTSVAESETEITEEESITRNEKNDKDGHYGFLKVMVFAGNEAFPVETARVEVLDENGERLYSVLTNSGGIAEKMVLPAPSERENDAPGGVDGFSTYTVKVSHPDYGTVVFEDVSVFEGIESIQQVFLQSKDIFGGEEDEDA